jgi:hypothetical protein
MVVPWKDFWTGGIKKIQKHKEERNRSGIFFLNKEKMEERKRRDVFSIGWDCPFATLPSGEPLVWESPLQHTFTRFVNQHKEHG